MPEKQEAEKYTPGPWTHLELFHRIETEREIIATVDGWELGDGKANARLISAAPEMAEALQLWLEYGKLDPMHPDSIEVYKLARSKAEAALKKAGVKEMKQKIGTEEQP